VLHREDLRTCCQLERKAHVSEQGDQWEEREQERQGGGDRENRGDSSSGETPPSRGDLPSGKNREAGTQQGNRESGTDGSGSQQGDVAHEGDLPTEGVPEAD
jgi:hypothetical protein